jgi:hydroxymethylpyrimidine pyrophosphatase-like HAD family hydrolase
MTRAAIGFAERIGVQTPMIVFNGALVIEPVSGQIIYENPIPLDLTREILRMAEEMGVYIQYFDRDQYYFARRCSYANAYGAHVGFAGIETKQPLSEWVTQPAAKLLADTRPEQRDEICAKFRERFGDSEDFEIVTVRGLGYKAVKKVE